VTVFNNEKKNLDLHNLTFKRNAMYMHFNCLNLNSRQALRWFYDILFSSTDAKMLVFSKYQGLYIKNVMQQDLRDAF